VQRLLAILCAGFLSLHVFFGKVASDASTTTHKITDDVTKRAMLVLALILGGNSVGFRNVTPAQLPNLTLAPDGTLDPLIFCRVLAPAFVHLVEGREDGLSAEVVAARRLEAAKLGLMRDTLLWPGSPFVSKGMVTRMLNGTGAGDIPIHQAWNLVSGHNNTAKSQWWMANIVQTLVQKGIGRLEQQADGHCYIKATPEDLSLETMQTLLMSGLQLSHEDVLQSAMVRTSKRLRVNPSDISEASQRIAVNASLGPPTSIARGSGDAVPVSAAAAGAGNTFL
jgi:hypothetical protein